MSSDPKAPLSSGGDRTAPSPALSPPRRTPIIKPLVKSKLRDYASEEEDEEDLALWSDVMANEATIRRLLGRQYPHLIEGEHKEGKPQERDDPEFWDRVSQHESLVRAHLVKLEKEAKEKEEQRNKPTDRERPHVQPQPQSSPTGFPPQMGLFFPPLVAAPAPAPAPIPPYGLSTQVNGAPAPGPDPAPAPAPGPGPPPNPVPVAASDSSKPSPWAIRPSLAEPTKFSGEFALTGKGLDIEAWLRYLDSYFVLTKFDESIKVTYALAHLEGAARFYMERILNSPTAPLSYVSDLNPSQSLSGHANLPMAEHDHGTWTWMKRRLTSQFEPFRKPQYLRDQLVSLSQARNKWTVQQYVTEFEKLASRVPELAEADRLLYFRNGLKPELKMKIDGAYYQVRTVEQAALIAAEEELLRRRAFEQRTGIDLHRHRHFPTSRPPMNLNATTTEEEQDYTEDYTSHMYNSETMDGYGASRLNAVSTSSSSPSPFTPSGSSTFSTNHAAERKPVCHYCHRDNHFVRDCREKARDVKNGIYRSNKFDNGGEGRPGQGRGGRGQQQGKGGAHKRE